MAHERTHPCLPCADIDQSIAFYESLGFRRTYRQVRPNPYAVVALEDMQVHLFGMPEFNPANSYGSVIVQVSDPDTLYHAFAAGLRKAFGKLPPRVWETRTATRLRRYERSNADWRVMAMRQPSNWPAPGCIARNWRIARTITTSRDRR